MARPQKQGIDYFSLDVQMDDNVKLIEATHGIVGFAVLVKLFQKIYSEEGYFYEWGEKHQLLFSMSVNVDRNTLMSIVSDCLKWGIFDQEIYETHNVLTSRGIQKRYLAATYKRAKVELVKEYLLVDTKERNNCLVTSIIEPDEGIGNFSEEVSDIQNQDTTIVSDDESTQSKVKESKVKKSILNTSSSDDGGASKMNVYKYFESNMSSINPILTDKLSDWVDEFNEEIVKLAIDQAVVHGARNMQYVSSILNNWKGKGVRTVVDAHQAIAEFKNKTGNTKTSTPKGNGNYGKTKFVNFKQRTDVDYDEVEKQLLAR